MGAIKHAIKTIEHGLEKAVKSVGQVVTGLATLDLKKAAAGVKGLASAGLDVARGAMDLTPAALAANTLMHGALDKVLKKAEKVATSVADKMVDNVEGGLSSVKNGVIATAKGIAHGNVGEVMHGLKDLATGAVETASNFGPGGIAKNLARMAVETVVDAAAQKVTKEAAKVLDPHGTSVLGGIAAQALGAAAGGALMGRGHSVGSFAQNSASNAAHSATETARQGCVDQLNNKLDHLLSPAGLAAVKSGGPDALSQAANKLAGEFVGQALRIGVESAIQQAIGTMSPKHASCLAELGHATGGAAQHIKQTLHDAIETAVRQAAATAIGDIVKEALEQAEHARNSHHGKAAAAMHQKVSDSVNHATHQVIEAVVGAVVDAASKAASSAPAASTNQQVGAHA